MAQDPAPDPTPADATNAVGTVISYVRSMKVGMTRTDWLHTVRDAVVLAVPALLSYASANATGWGFGPHTTAEIVSFSTTALFVWRLIRPPSTPPVH